jgi:hypothetical protein
LFNEFPVEFIKQSELVKDWKDSKYNAAKVNVLKTILTTVSSAIIAEKFKSKNIERAVVFCFGAFLYLQLSITFLMCEINNKRFGNLWTHTNISCIVKFLRNGLDIL